MTKFRGLVAFALIWGNGPLLAGAPHFGVKIPVSRYEGCSALPILGELESGGVDLAKEMAQVMTRPSQRFEISFGGYVETVKMKLLDFPSLPSWAEGREARLVEIPEQTFVLSQLAQSVKHIRDVHMTGRSQVAYGHGYYVLMAVPPAGEVKAVDDALFSLSHSIVIQGPGKGLLSEGRYAVVPADFYFETLFHSGENTLKYWSFSRPFIPEIPFRESHVVTARGTHYHFRESGEVTVWDRRGNKVHETKLDVASEGGYSSHAEILRRQGIVTKVKNDYEGMEIGIAKNRDQIRDYCRASSIPETNIGFLFASLDRFFKLYERETEIRGKASLVSQALSASNDIEQVLPPHLRWEELGRTTLKAKRLPDGTFPASAVQRFVIFRGVISMPVMVLNDSIHLQAAHAHLGDFALKLDAENLIAGGSIETHYNPDTGELLSVSIPLNGMLSLAGKSRVELTPEEIGAVVRRLKYQVSEKVPVTAPCLEPSK